jgi:hypothetical protein
MSHSVNNGAKIPFEFCRKHVGKHFVCHHMGVYMSPLHAIRCTSTGGMLKH